MNNVCIYGVSNGVGITRDMNIIKDVLTSVKYEVDCVNPFRSTSGKKYKLAIWLERFVPSLFSNAEINVMIPNQEWFEPGWIPMLKAFHTIFTKTKYADNIFQNLGCNTEYISFTSLDRYLPSIEKDHAHWIHVAGKSIQKQTDVVLATWEKNPGYPQLTFIRDPKFFKPRTVFPNINYMYDKVPDNILKVMQNANIIHVCPSTTEGFGHYIMEAMSCKCLPLVTNASPMTEFVTAERGFLVEATKQEQMRLSVANIVSQSSLEKAVLDILITEDNRKVQMGENARAFFLENDKFFKQRLVEVVNNLMN